MSLSAAVLAVVATLASCSGSSGTSSDHSPATKARWDAFCAAREACLSGSECPSSACMAELTEEGPLNEFLDCQNAKACGANDDDCYASAGTTDAERQAFTARCEAALGAIPSSPTCYVEPVICTIVAYPILRKQYMHAVDACLTVPCDGLVACIDAAMAPLNCT